MSYHEAQQFNLTLPGEGPFTEHELNVEREYRVNERVGINFPHREPTPEELAEITDAVFWEIMALPRE